VWGDWHKVGARASYDGQMRLLAVVVAALGLAAPAANAEPNPFFRTPSKNIYCGYGSPWVRCDISSGLKPKPQKPAGCDFDWGQTYLLSGTGRARLGCVSDSVFSPTSRVLKYGTRWSRGGITCVSKATGLRCANRSGHGFFMSRQRSYRF
jgi:hypothetical protein